LAHAEIVEFSVDPAQTRWSVRGGYFPGGITQAELEPQSPGSMVTRLPASFALTSRPQPFSFCRPAFSMRCFSPFHNSRDSTVPSAPHLQITEWRQ
jgi:hypothetical protein